MCHLPALPSQPGRHARHPPRPRLPTPARRCCPLAATQTSTRLPSSCGALAQCCRACCASIAPQRAPSTAAEHPVPAPAPLQQPHHRRQHSGHRRLGRVSPAGRGRQAGQACCAAGRRACRAGSYLCLPHNHSLLCLSHHHPLCHRRSATTLVNLLLDANKMRVVREWRCAGRDARCWCWSTARRWRWIPARMPTQHPGTCNMQPQGPADGRLIHHRARAQAGRCSGRAAALLLLHGAGKAGRPCPCAAMRLRRQGAVGAAGRRPARAALPARCHTQPHIQRTSPCAALPQTNHHWQALRLFVHFPFLIRAAAHCRASGAAAQHAAIGRDAVATCLRGQTFFSLGLRLLYAFIPLVGWLGAGRRAGCAGAAQAANCSEQLKCEAAPDQPSPCL